MKKIKIGIMSTKDVHKRMIDIASGHYTPKRGEPKVWFSSMKSLSEVLSDNNRKLLKVIADNEPENIQALANITGRKASNLSRTLKTFEHYGFIKMIKISHSKKPVAMVSEFDISLRA
jgi:predicted transcriptional regulator